MAVEAARAESAPIDGRRIAKRLAIVPALRVRLEIEQADDLVG